MPVFVTNYACKDDDIVGEANHSRSRPISSIPAAKVQLRRECTRRLELECCKLFSKTLALRDQPALARRGKKRHPPMYENFNTLSRAVVFFPSMDSKLKRLANKHCGEKKRSERTRKFCVLCQQQRKSMFFSCVLLSFPFRAPPSDEEKRFFYYKALIFLKLFFIRVFVFVRKTHGNFSLSEYFAAGYRSVDKQYRIKYIFSGVLEAEAQQQKRPLKRKCFAMRFFLALSSVFRVDC